MIRESILKELKRRGKPRIWLAKHKLMEFEENHVYKWLRGDVDAGTLLIENTFEILKLKIVPRRKPKGE